MHFKLACLMLCAVGPAAFPLLVPAGQFDAAGGVPAPAYARADTAAALPRWESLVHSLELPAGTDEMALSDSERLQLREQIRAAARDLYPDIYQSGAAGAVSDLRAPKAAP